MHDERTRSLMHALRKAARVMTHSVSHILCHILCDTFCVTHSASHILCDTFCVTHSVLKPCAIVSACAAVRCACVPYMYFWVHALYVRLICMVSCVV